MKNSKGFTLIEIMVVIAIVAALSAVVLAFLGSSRNKGNDSKIQSQLKSMAPQAQLFSGTLGTAFTVGGLAQTTAYSGSITGAASPSGTPASGTLFNDTNISHYSLYRLASALPNGTLMYYGWDGISPILGGKWFFAATTSDGAFCIDYTNNAKKYVGAIITTNPSTWVQVGVFPSAQSPNYLCN